MKEIKMFNKCILMTADNTFVRQFPFSEYVLIKDPLTQIGIELQRGIDKDFVRIDGWKYKSKKGFKQLIDAVVELAKVNDFSCIYYIDVIKDKDAKKLVDYGFHEGKNYASSRQFIFEVTA